MAPSRRGFLIGSGALALGGQSSQAQPVGQLRVTGARPTIFYAPLIACVTQGFLKKHGVEATFHWLGSRARPRGSEVISDGRNEICPQMGKEEGESWIKNLTCDGNDARHR